MRGDHIKCSGFPTAEKGIPHPHRAQLWRGHCSSMKLLTIGGQAHMNFIGWILFGLVVGAIAKFLMPGRDPGGWIVTILLGIAGSFVGGFLATQIMGSDQAAAGWIGSILGAMILLFIYRMIVGRRRVV
ncbi:MAG TPA: GlsB/YeaQ/YmgE family stress response membrane protein [Thermoanaerobaculia bacterium]